MRIDSHQHFWCYDPQEYNWIGSGMEVLKKDYLPVDLQPLLDHSELDGSIAVQARQTLEETQFLLGLAKEWPGIIKGVVGWVDICSQDVETQLKSFAENKTLKGIRHIVQDEPDDDFMLRPDFQDGISCLSKFNLTYDLLTFTRHLPRACTVVANFPEQRFVLDHISKPPIKSKQIHRWEEEIKALAKYPNVWCKLSGMVTETHWENWSVEDFSPYLDVVFHSFGTERLMFGSDWPVCLLAGKYSEVIKIIRSYVIKNYPEAEELIFGKNCANFYGI